jgi:hypothetical protein
MTKGMKKGDMTKWKWKKKGRPDQVQVNEDGESWPAVPNVQVVVGKGKRYSFGDFQKSNG